MSFVPDKWTHIDPADAAGFDLRRTSEIEGPLNEHGEVCPWPWEFQQLTFEANRVHTCSYCGTMGTPGLVHPDYRAVLPPEAGTEPAHRRTT